MGIRAEELAERMLNRHIREVKILDDATFRTALEATFKDNDEAYRRLAK